MKKLLFAMFALGVVALGACNDDDDVKKRDITVEFASAQIGIDAEDRSEDITVTLSRKSDAALTATVSVETEGVEYGTHFTTSPAATNGVISLSIPAGRTTATITVTKTADVFLDGNETVTFTISELSVTEGVKTGEKSACEVTFGSIVSKGGEMTLEGRTGDTGADVYTNSVYVDLSGNKQTAIDRKSWNLGFYCGDGFRVILNGAYGTAATPSAKTDIGAVTVADAEALADEYNLNVATMGGTFSLTIYDNPDGSLAGTAFAEVSATDSENKVYFLASEGQKTGDRGDWYKVRVTRKGEGYSMQYGKVSGGAVKTMDIEKNDGYNMVFVSLEAEKIVSVEPMAGKWDIKWSYDWGTTPMAGSTQYMVMQDFVSINNLGGVKVATVMTADVTYDNFSKANLAGLTFKGDRDAIGSGWRSAMGGMGGTSGIYTDRFYVIKDPAGFHYKLRFERFGMGDTGTRGRPEIKYALVE